MRSLAQRFRTFTHSCNLPGILRFKRVTIVAAPAAASELKKVLPILAAIILGVVQPSAAAPTNLIHVTTTVQGDSRGQGPSGGPLCSLTEAIFAANTDTNQALDASGNLYTTGCEPGSGDDTIVLTNAVYPMMDFEHNIQHSRYGPTATPVIFTNITIQGYGATIQRATGSPNMRAFTVGFDQVDLGGASVSGWGNLTLQNVTIQGFTVKGGDGGAGGGGGGMGAGGAVYADGQGSSSVGLTVVNSTFTGNGATGGNGGGPGHIAGGGGGGLSGNGGEGPDGGGGGGGAYGNGGDGNPTVVAAAAGVGTGGGGGGGTDSSGQSADASGHGAGAGFCGGPGGNGGLVTSLGSGDNGSDADCPGGGGGGGGSYNANATLGQSFLNGGHGGTGSYGGGGGGSGQQFNNGGNGGFGGGGGGAADLDFGTGICIGKSNAGKGGFGGGGGGANGFFSLCSNKGVGGRFGGDGGPGLDGGGGGGAALGGAIFSDTSTVLIQNSTFFNNFVDRGFGEINGDNGADGGGAIFTRNGSLTVKNVTISGNQATGSGGGIVVVNDGSATSLTLQNTIIAGNGANECFLLGSVTTSGAGNLIVSNGSGSLVSPCPNVVSAADPLLAALTLNPPGNTPTMALQTDSPAIMAADPGTSLPTDQRGVGRKGTPDIGAYETGLVTETVLTSSNNPSVYGSKVIFTGTVTNISSGATPTASLAITIDGAPVAATVAGSGNALTATYSTETLLAGPHSVVATYTNSGNFLPSGPASLTQTVNAARLVIRANDASRVIDTPNPSFTATYTGFVNGDTPASLTGTLACTTSTNQFSPVGNYPITCSGLSSPNYNITYEPGTLTITATATSAAMLVGDLLTGGCIDNGGIANALTSKLAAAQAAISASNIQTAINTLTALKNQITAQAAKHIGTSCATGGIVFDTANVLLLDVQGIIDSLRVSAIADPITGYVANTGGIGVPGAVVSILDAGGNTLATATTDITGYYFFATTGVLVPGISYTVAVTSLPAGLTTSTPVASPAFTWTGTGIMIGNFVLN